MLVHVHERAGGGGPGGDGRCSDSATSAYHSATLAIIVLVADVKLPACGAQMPA